MVLAWGGLHLSTPQELCLHLPAHLHLHLGRMVIAQGSLHLSIPQEMCLPLPERLHLPLKTRFSLWSPCRLVIQLQTVPQHTSTAAKPGE